MNAPQAQRAFQILEEVTPAFVVDRPRLERLLKHIVEETRGHTVEKLERLYSILSQTIYHHKQEFNKMQMIMEMEQQLESFV